VMRPKCADKKRNKKRINKTGTKAKSERSRCRKKRQHVDI
jgi:hypothetical protein